MFRVAFDLHWGIIVADRDCTMNGATVSIKMSQFKIQNILTVVKIILEKLFPNATWNVGQRNVMNELNYNVQVDGFSCGFYVKGLVLSYAVRFISVFPGHSLIL